MSGRIAEFSHRILSSE